MKLLYGNLNLVYEFHENEVQVLIMENPKTFAETIWDFQKQMMGEEGQIILSDNDKILPLEKCSELIINPFDLEINNRRILGKLYQEMKEISDEDFYLQIGELRTKIVTYLDDVSMKLPYPICFNSEMEVLNLYKLFDLKLEEGSDSLLQKVTDYLKIMSSLCGIKLVVFVNIKNYFNDEQLLELYKTSFYYKINLLLIEAAQRNRISGEKISILDSQDCLIEF